MQKEFKVAGIGEEKLGVSQAIIIAQNGEAWLIDALTHNLPPIGTIMRVPSSQIDGMPSFTAYNFLKSREARRATRAEIAELWTPEFAVAS